MVSIRACLIAAALVLNAPAADLTKEETNDLLARIAAARPPAVEADFTESRRVALLAHPITESGTLAIAQPNFLRREVTNGTLTICDGTTLWMVYPEFDEVERYPVAENRPLAELITAMTAGLQLRDLGKSFSVTARREQQGFLLTLAPKGSLRRSIKTITVTVAANLEPHTIHVQHTNGDTTTTTLSNQRPLRDKRARFNIPPAQ